MMELLRVDTVKEAVGKVLEQCRGVFPKKEKVPVMCAAGRTLAEDVYSYEDVPGFARSAMDGYAVRSADAGGASDTLPVFLKCTGEVQMGEETRILLGPGECAAVSTGGMLPEGADAVAMIEYCECFGSDMISVRQPLSPWKNTVRPGDDIKKGSIALKKGRKLKASDIGLLSAVGVTDVVCFEPVSVYIISTGDELVDPESRDVPKGKMRDVNTRALAARAAELGLLVRGCEALRDDEDEIEAAVRRGSEAADTVVVSGGSSKGAKDATERIFKKVTKGNVLTHGIAMKPGKPTITAVDRARGTFYLGLPGHPAAALLVFGLFMTRIWQGLTGANEHIVPYVEARLSFNIPAAPGRETYQPVRLEKRDGNLYAVPILGKSGLIRTLSEADGYIVMDIDDEGAGKSEVVRVYMI